MKSYITGLHTWYRNTLSNPKYRWWIILGTVAYLFMPFDISPDFLPIVGQIDDLAIVSLLVAELSQMALGYVKSRQSHSEDTMPDGTVDVQAIPLD